MDIYDTVEAHTLEGGEHISFKGSLLENIRVVDDTSAIVVIGYSHEEGDNQTLPLDPFDLVDLWSA